MKKNNTLRKVSMKHFIFLITVILGANTFAAQYTQCKDEQVTLTFASTTDPDSANLGINTLILMTQNRGGVPLPLMAHESSSGNITTYMSPYFEKVQDFKMIVSRPMDKFKDFVGHAVIDGEAVDLICN
jgi:hypothetical protein